MLGAEPGLSQSMAEASSDGLAGLPAMLSGALPPDTYTAKLCDQQLSTFKSLTVSPESRLTPA